MTRQIAKTNTVSIAPTNIQTSLLMSLLVAASEVTFADPSGIFLHEKVKDSVASRSVLEVVLERVMAPEFKENLLV